MLKLFSLLGVFTLLLCPCCVQSCSTVSDDECLDCYRVLVAWNSYRRRVNFNEQPRLSSVQNDLGCIYPEYHTHYQNGREVIEVWDADFQDYYEMQDDTSLPNNTKVNIRYEVDLGFEMQNHLVSNRTRNEQRLKQILLRNYDNTVGACTQDDEPCQVLVSTIFQKIINVDLSDGSMSLVVWLRLRWQDLRLVWDPIEWDGIDSVSFRLNEVWNPEVEIWNNEDPRNQGLLEQQMKVNSTGHIFWSRNGQLAVSCDLEGLVKFPYDHPRCIFEVGSWEYEDNIVQVKLYGPVYSQDEDSWSKDENQFSPYKIEKMTVSENSYLLQHPYCNDKTQRWSSLEYMIILSRPHWKYTIGIIIPLILLSALSCSGLWVTPSGGERLAYAITILASVVVYQLLMYYELPATKGLVYASYLSFGCFFQSALICIESVVVVSLWEREEEVDQMHGWFFYITNFVLLFFKSTCVKFRQIRIRIIQSVNKLRAKTFDANSNTSNEIQLAHQIQPYARQVEEDSQLGNRNMQDTSNKKEKATSAGGSSSCQTSNGGGSSSFSGTTFQDKNQLDGENSMLENAFDLADNQKWKKLSKKIDTIAQIITSLIVVLYAVILSLVIQA